MPNANKLRDLESIPRPVLSSIVKDLQKQTQSNFQEITYDVRVLMFQLSLVIPAQGRQQNARIHQFEMILPALIEKLQ
jgi:hypothetical protein